MTPPEKERLKECPKVYRKAIQQVDWLCTNLKELAPDEKCLLIDETANEVKNVLAKIAYSLEAKPTIAAHGGLDAKISGAYKRYPDLKLDEISPDEVAKMFEMAVLLNTEYAQKSFVHKMLLQGAHSIRQLQSAQCSQVRTREDYWKIFNAYCEKEFGKPTSYAPEVAGAGWMLDALIRAGVVRCE